MFEISDSTSGSGRGRDSDRLWCSSTRRVGLAARHCLLCGRWGGGIRVVRGSVSDTYQYTVGLRPVLFEILKFWR